MVVIARRFNIVLIAGIAIAVVACNDALAKDRNLSRTKTDAAVAGSGRAGYKGAPDAASDDFLDYVDDREFDLAGDLIDSAAVVEVACASTDAACVQKGGKIRFLVVPEKGAHKADWGRALRQGSNHGHVVAKLINMDRVAVPSMQLDASTPVYEWVGKTGNNQTGIKLFSINGNTLNFLRAAGGYGQCTPVSSSNKRSKSAAKYKPDHPNSEWNCSQFPLVRKDDKLRMAMPDDMWVSCSAGCCQATFS